MAEVSFDLQKLAQRNLQTEEELRHVRRFLSLVEQCREYDTMHPGQLRDLLPLLLIVVAGALQLLEVALELVDRVGIRGVLNIDLNLVCHGVCSFRCLQIRIGMGRLLRTQGRGACRFC